MFSREIYKFFRTFQRTPGDICFCFVSYVTLCGYIMNENAVEVLENLPKLEQFLPDDEKISLIYVAGYLCRHDDN